MQFLGDPNNPSAVNVVMAFICKVVKKFPHLRQSMCDKLTQTFTEIKSGKAFTLLCDISKRWGRLHSCKPWQQKDRPRHTCTIVLPTIDNRHRITMSDWRSPRSSTESDDAPAPTAASIVTKIAVKSEWEGEDEEESSPVSDWDASSDESSDDDKPAAAPVAPPQKKGTVKQKIAEKEAAKAARVGNDDVEYDEDSVLDPRNKARFDREREIKADLDNAAALFGAAGLGADPFTLVFAGTSSSDLDAPISANPHKREFPGFLSKNH
ncbi:hypothetical protein EV424DRAFT_1543973 [Suillus variegatus]|nr:hypothetical protein EV424DRAFT_1543973 [Suillus variegatus]